MMGNNSTGSFMNTISSYSYDPNLPLNSGAVDQAALIQTLGEAPSPTTGFFIIKSITCPKTGAAGYSLVYNLWGEKHVDVAGGLETCY